MTMPFYASPEQVMRDRSEYARKGIARGRGVVVLTCADGVLFVAENPSRSLQKISEIYDRIGFAAAGRYNEYTALRVAGIRHADVRGYLYDRRDVNGRTLANAYAQTLGQVFLESAKPLEVEVCVAEVGDTPELDQLYRLTYDGSVGDERDFVTMGGQAEDIRATLRELYRPNMSLADATAAAVRALASVGGEGTRPRELAASQLEVALLDRSRPNRKFSRITDRMLTELLPDTAPKKARGESGPSEDSGSGGNATQSSGSEARDSAGTDKTNKSSTSSESSDGGNSKEP